MINTKDSSTSNNTSTYLSVGVHQNCFIKSVEIKTPKAKSLIEIYVSNDAGSSQKKAIWIPDPNSPYIAAGENTEQAKEREVNELRDQCATILLALFPGELAHISAPTIDSFVQQFVAKINQAIVGKNRVSVIVQYDSSEQYSEFPKWGWIKKYSGEDVGFDLDRFRMSKSATNLSGVSGSDVW